MSEVRLELVDATLREMISRVHQLTGITMGVHKRNLLEGRLSKRVRELGLTSFEDYLERLDRDDTERQAFINAVTTNETHFFRTPAIWEHIEREYLPRFFVENPGKKLRIWSAAASSGQEAYSLAMLCLEFKAKHPGFMFEIYASDISTEVLAIAESGIYQGRTVEELKSKFPERLEQYFHSIESGE